MVYKVAPPVPTYPRLRTWPFDNHTGERGSFDGPDGRRGNRVQRGVGDRGRAGRHGRGPTVIPDGHLEGQRETLFLGIGVNAHHIKGRMAETIDARRHDHQHAHRNPGPWSACCWPMLAEVGIWVFPGPAVENSCQSGSLSASRRQVPLQHEHQEQIPFRGEVRHIFGDNSPAFRAGSGGHLCVVDCSEAYFVDVDGVVAMSIAQQFSCGCREHFIDRERRHASSASRCSAVLRLRSAMSRLWSIRSRTSSECSAA